jgi:hypothetical protein
LRPRLPADAQSAGREPASRHAVVAPAAAGAAMSPRLIDALRPVAATPPGCAQLVPGFGDFRRSPAGIRLAPVEPASPTASLARLP